MGKHMIEQEAKEKIMTELIHCGCGGEPEIFHIAPEEYEGSYCVRCTKCLTQTPFFNKDKDKAIEVWNRAMGAKDINVPNKLLKSLPSAEPERKTGEWIYEGKRGRFPACKCSICGHYENADWAILQGANFCPHCGADMRGE